MSLRDDSINLYETKRARNTLLNEPYSSGKMLFHPLGLYSINFNSFDKHYLNIKLI